eukprot:1498572-Rhodomonas_salina.4
MSSPSFQAKRDKKEYNPHKKCGCLHLIFGVERGIYAPDAAKMKPTACSIPISCTEEDTET